MLLSIPLYFCALCVAFLVYHLYLQQCWWVDFLCFTFPPNGLEANQPLNFVADKRSCGKEKQRHRNGCGSDIGTCQQLAFCTDTLSSQCRTPWLSWWSDSWPGSLPRTWTGEMYFSQTQEGTEQEKSTWENAARIAYGVYEGFQWKEQTLAVAVDLEDAYNRVQVNLLMELLVQYGVSLTLTQWLATALQERKMTMRLGSWISKSQQLTLGLPQAPPLPLLSPVLNNVHTKGLV